MIIIFILIYTALNSSVDCFRSIGTITCVPLTYLHHILRPKANWVSGEWLVTKAGGKLIQRVHTV